MMDTRSVFLAVTVDLAKQEKKKTTLAISWSKNWVFLWELNRPLERFPKEPPRSTSLGSIMMKMLSTSIGTTPKMKRTEAALSLGIHCDALHVFFRVSARKAWPKWHDRIHLHHVPTPFPIPNEAMRDNAAAKLPDSPLRRRDVSCHFSSVESCSCRLVWKRRPYQNDPVFVAYSQRNPLLSILVSRDERTKPPLSMNEVGFILPVSPATVAKHFSNPNPNLQISMSFTSETNR